jgi:hypothetical protein
MNIDLPSLPGMWAPLVAAFGDAVSGAVIIWWRRHLEFFHWLRERNYKSAMPLQID